VAGLQEENRRIAPPTEDAKKTRTGSLSA
jgi:hypothetical protein